jgi:5-formyltetrahydrofolate cyclo-ligase
VVAYAPIGNEVDPAAIVVAAVVRGKGTFYPRTDGARLEFVHSRPEQLRPGWHGIPEPDGNEYLAPLAHDVLFLVPGVAFASNGARLGRGAGCYDRALARYPHGSRAGLAYEMQLVAAIPEDPWDQRVDLVITEARVITVAAASRAETLE